MAPTRPFIMLAVLTIVLLFPMLGYAQLQRDENGNNPLQTRAKSKPRGLLNPLFNWASDDSHGILMGAIQKIDLDNNSITLLNQQVTIDEDTVFLGKLTSLADLKTGRTIMVTAQVSNDKITALEIYRMPKPTKKKK